MIRVKKTIRGYVGTRTQKLTGINVRLIRKYALKALAKDYIRKQVDAQALQHGYELPLDGTKFVMANGAIRIGFATVNTIQIDPSLYFDTPGDIGKGIQAKFNQGHWVRGTHGLFSTSGGNDLVNTMTQAQRNAVYKGFIDDTRGGATSGPTNLKGFFRPFNWAQLEQGNTKAIAQANRNFDQIAGDLLYLTTQGQRLCVMIENRQYDNSGITTPPAPTYINNHLDNTNGQGTLGVTDNTGGGVPALYANTGGASPGNSTRIYQGFVWQALNELVRDFASTPVLGDTGGPGGTARTFDQHPNFEGIFFQETAIGINAADLNYDESYYIDAQFGGTNPSARGEPVLADMWGATAGKKSVVPAINTIINRDGLLINAAKYWPNSRIFFVMNFLQGQEGRKTNIAAAINGLNIVWGGPDCQPDDTGFSKSLTAEYIVMNSHRLDPLPTMIQMSPGGPAGSYTATHTNHVPYYTGNNAANGTDFSGASPWAVGSGWGMKDLFVFASRNPPGTTQTDYNNVPGLGAKYIFWYTANSSNAWQIAPGGDGPSADSATGVIQAHGTFN